MSRYCLITGINYQVNAIDTKKELSLTPPENGQYMVLTSIFYVLENQEEFMNACRKLLLDTLIDQPSAGDAVENNV